MCCCLLRKWPEHLTNAYVQVNEQQPCNDYWIWETNRALVEKRLTVKPLFLISCFPRARYRKGLDKASFKDKKLVFISWALLLMGDDLQYFEQQLETKLRNLDSARLMRPGWMPGSWWSRTSILRRTSCDKIGKLGLCYCASNSKRDHNVQLLFCSFAASSTEARIILY